MLLESSVQANWNLYDRTGLLRYIAESICPLQLDAVFEGQATSTHSFSAQLKSILNSTFKNAIPTTKSKCASPRIGTNLVIIIIISSSSHCWLQLHHAETC